MVMVNDFENVAIAATPIDVITDDTSPETLLIETIEPVNPPAIELWHYSGGYWGYGSNNIYDTDLRNNLTNEDALASYLGEISFDFPINSEVYSSIIRDGDATIKLSTDKEIYNKERNEYYRLSISDYFYGEVKSELYPNKIVIKGQPKLHFTLDTYAEIIPDHFNRVLPLVDPNYGYNVYAIWGRNSAVDYGGARGYFDPNSTDGNMTDPTGEGRIPIGWIENVDGHLKDGVGGHLSDDKDFLTNGITGRNTEDCSIGYYTFRNAGAVGVHFEYPIKLEIYSSQYLDDIQVNETKVTDAAAVGSEVTIGLEVESTFGEDTSNVPFELSVTDSLGVNVPDIEVTGQITDTEVGNSSFTSFTSGETKLIYVTFTMPDDFVDFHFAVNEDGLSPVEVTLDNNVFDQSITGIIPVTTIEPYDLDYNVYRRDINFDLASNSASLSLPKGHWDGNASGSLNVTNDTGTYLSNFLVSNNAYVNENSSYITRTPEVDASLIRPNLTGWNDNPQGGAYYNPPDPTNAINQTGQVSYSGSVSRPYEYTKYDQCHLSTPDLFDTCPGHTRHSSTSASFTTGNHQLDINVYSYNGQPTITEKHFDDVIYNNTTNSTTKSLYWTSEDFTLNVVRWMYHINEYDAIVNSVTVDGQYDRTFKNQCSGEIDWRIDSGHSLGEEYYQSREAARSGNQVSSYYDKAVFSSDKSQYYTDYPIKSGYYFNPTGTYTFTVETEVYKDVHPGGSLTSDHQAMVDEVLESFRYTSNLVYINNSGIAVDLQGNTVSTSNGKYNAQAATLSVNNPYSVDGRNLINILDRNDNSSRYSQTVSTITHSESTSGTTDTILKEVLEGYSESGTYTSNSAYKYREYVDDSERLYKITETSTITIEVNPSNDKVYTHARMEDGTYFVRAWIDNVNLVSADGTHAYDSLGTVNGVSSLDEITVTVKGSMYDDINN